MQQLASDRTVTQRYWWMFAVRGFIAILFGLAAFIWPHLTLLTLLILFAIYALIDGFIAVVASIQGSQHYSRWWVLLLEGIVGIVIAMVTFFCPAITALALLYVIASWAIITGVLEIGQAFTKRREISNEWLMALAGVVSVLLGLILLASPVAGLLALVWVIGVYAIVFGVVLVARAFQFRTQTTKPTAPAF